MKEENDEVKTLNLNIDQDRKLPFKGVFSPSKEKKFQETILIVPFYGAISTELQKHVFYFNDLGFDVVSFSLKRIDDLIRTPQVSSRNFIYGIKSIWTDQIEGVLNEISGKKIVYAFSNPASSALDAISRRRAIDIVGAICDSGPSAQKLLTLWKYYTHIKPIALMPLRLAATIGSSLFWKEDSVLSDIPKQFPVLSIRGWRDSLISPNEIDEYFAPYHHLDWQKLNLPKAQHLNGLKDFPEDYKPGVEKFLLMISTKTT